MKKQSYLPPIDDAIAEFLDALDAELFDLAEQHGPIGGPVRPTQRPYALALDRVHAAREEGTAC